MKQTLEPTYLQSDDKSVFGCTKEIHGIDKSVVDNDDKAEHKEGSILKRVWFLRKYRLVLTRKYKPVR